jgi:protein-S-isoprenylcysteine O-methyltransferase Ste14
MGREVEKLKLRATFQNNLAAGILLGGLLIPYLAIIPNFGSLCSRLFEGPSFNRYEIINALGVLFSMALAMQGSAIMRRHANNTLDQLPE